MGHQLGMTVIANGVESQAQLGFLRRNDCDVFQGYLFGEPMSADAAGMTLRRRYLRPEAFAETRPDRTLLLLDDEENVLRSLVRLFRRDGYRILAAGNVRDAFDLLAINDVQVILSDQRMSDMSGTEFLGRVKMLYPDTIRLVLSGYTDLNTVTDAIKALEQRLGVRLLNRTTRLVAPTLEGEVFYGRCLRLIADMDDAEAAFRDVPPRGPLRIEVHGTLGRHLLFPHLPDFLQRYPDIELDVSEGDRYVDLLREGVDAAIRVGTLADSDLAARRPGACPWISTR
ncbi:hypothetical protein G6F68_011565 [Rhizopus microsporus]|nr:hypothetical protein G6F68_011565 [Rhizopus microsporus]